MKKDSLFPLDGEVGKKEQAKVKRNKVKKSVRVSREILKVCQLCHFATAKKSKTNRKQIENKIRKRAENNYNNYRF